MDYTSYEQGRQQGRTEAQQNNNDGGGLFFMIALLLLTWACLYPLAALPAIAVGGLVAWVADGLGGSRQEGLNHFIVMIALPILCGLFVAWPMSRLDHLCATRNWYRVVRHLVRLVLFAVVVGLGHFQFTTEGGIGRLGHDPSRLLDDPIRVGVMLACVVFGHLVLWSWRGLRAEWHEAMMWVRLRPRSLGM